MIVLSLVKNSFRLLIKAETAVSLPEVNIVLSKD